MQENGRTAAAVHGTVAFHATFVSSCHSANKPGLTVSDLANLSAMCDPPPPGAPDKNHYPTWHAYHKMKLVFSLFMAQTCNECDP
jgi:hypothetical protein